MMKRWAIFGVFLALAAVLLSGCWNRRELNELSIAVAMGIDLSKNGYILSLQIVNAREIAAKDGAGYSLPVTVYREEGKTVFEALRRVSSKLNHKVYLSHMRIVVISEELARRGIGEPLDFVSRDHEMRTDFFVVIARQRRAEEVISILTPMAKIPANQMYSSLRTGETTWASVTDVTLDLLMSDLLTKGKNPAITGVSIVGDTESGEMQSNVKVSQPPAIPQYSGMSVFRDDRLVGWLTEFESRGYNYFTDRVQSTVVRIACPPRGHIGVELIRTKSKLKARMEDGRPILSVTLDAEGNLGDVECGLDITKEDTLRRLEADAEEAIRQSMQAAVDKAKRLKSDIFGFGNALHRADAREWKRRMPEWHDTFVDVLVEVEVDVKLRRIGTITNSVVKELKE